MDFTKIGTVDRFWRPCLKRGIKFGPSCSGSKIYFRLNVVQGFRTLPNLAVVRVCIFAVTRGNTETFAQIETVG